MKIRFFAFCVTAVWVLVVVISGSGVGFAAVWDQGCERAINSMHDTQQRIQHMRGNLVSHDMQGGFSNLFVKGEREAPRFSESELQSTEKKMRNLIELFNNQLREFSEACLKDPAA